jgi:hypothetical protein
MNHLSEFEGLAESSPTWISIAALHHTSASLPLYGGAMAPLLAGQNRSRAPDFYHKGRDKQNPIDARKHGCK